MTIELNSAGPPLRGPFLDLEAGARTSLKVALPRARGEEKDPDEEWEEEVETTRRPLPFSPEARALRAAHALERNRKIVSLMEPSSLLPLLGSRLNVLA
jgi:hypothetical protein